MIFLVTMKNTKINIYDYVDLVVHCIVQLNPVVLSVLYHHKLNSLQLCDQPRQRPRASADDSLLWLGKFRVHGKPRVVVDPCGLLSPWRRPGSCPTPCLDRVGMDLCGQRYQHRRQGEGRRGDLINIMSLVVPIDDVQIDDAI